VANEEIPESWQLSGEVRLQYVSDAGVRHESDKEECEKRKREVTMGFVPHRPYQGMRS